MMGAMPTALRAELQGADTTTAAVVERATQLGLLGWVREDPDALRVHAEGTPGAVDQLRGWLAAAGTLAEQRARVEGHEQFAVRGVPAGAFSVPATEGGYELHLEVDGVVRAWALRKEPSMEPAQRRMAIELAAPQATGEPWDGGPYEQGGRVSWPEAIDRGHAVFVLHGERLEGGFALQRTRGTGPGSQWLLIKRKGARHERIPA
jgi:acylphosphatase